MKIIESLKRLEEKSKDSGDFDVVKMCRENIKLLEKAEILEKEFGETVCDIDMNERKAFKVLRAAAYDLECEKPDDGIKLITTHRTKRMARDMANIVICLTAIQEAYGITDEDVFKEYKEGRTVCGKQ